MCDLITSAAKLSEASSQFDFFQPSSSSYTLFHQAPVIALAASAGGLHALSVILASLPRNFPAPILVAQHLSPDFPSQMDWLLGRRTSLCVKWAADGDRPQAGSVYLGPPGRHLLVRPDGTLSLRHAEKVGIGRPSADILFRSLASIAGERVVAAVLTGMCWDGARGIRAVKAAGGVTVAQDAQSSRFPGMPYHAALTGAVDHVLPLPQIGPLLIKLTGVNCKLEFESLP